MQDSRNRGFSLLSTWRAGRQDKREREKAVSDTIEIIVEGTDRRIRVVHAYKRKLEPAVERTLAFIEELVASLPAPLELSRHSWQADPTVNALFATAEDVRITLSGSKELRNFFQSEAVVQHAYALLAVTRKEKTVLGIDLSGDLLQRDVKQTSVGFGEQRILAPGATEADARDAVKKSALNLFINHAQKRLLDSQGRRDGLERERQVLQIRLKYLRTRENSLAAVEGGATEIEEFEKKLAENIKTQESLGGTAPTMDDYLEQVRIVFANPEQHLGHTTVSFRVNRMGIKQDEKSTTPGIDLNLFELSMDTVKRIVTLVR